MLLRFVLFFFVIDHIQFFSCVENQTKHHSDDTCECHTFEAVAVNVDVIRMNKSVPIPFINSTTDGSAWNKIGTGTDAPNIAERCWRLSAIQIYQPALHRFQYSNMDTKAANPLNAGMSEY